MPKGETRGQNLRHIFLRKKNWIFFIESFVFEQHALFSTDYHCVTSDFRVHDQGCDWRSKFRTPLKCFYIFLTYAGILPTIYQKAFIFGHLVPFMACFHSTALDSWVCAPG